MKDYWELFNIIKSYMTIVGKYSSNQDISYTGNELKQLEKNLGITMGGSFKAYFSIFGKLKTAATAHNGPINFISDFYLRRFYKEIGPQIAERFLSDYLNDKEEDKGYRPELDFPSLVRNVQNTTKYNDTELTLPKFKNNNIIFLQYDDQYMRYLFVTDETDSPFYLYEWSVYTYIESAPSGDTISSLVRESLWHYILIHAGKNEKIAKEVLVKIPWLTYYKQNFSNDFLANIVRNNDNMLFERTSFHKTLGDKDLMYSVDRYEVEFIRYLINTGKKKYQNSTFNPDDYLNCDFREYLK